MTIMPQVFFAQMLVQQWFLSALAPVECGLRPLVPNRVKRIAIRPGARVVGGLHAPYGHYPWTAGIRTVTKGLTDSNGAPVTSHWCGGIVVNENWILSAAHCFQL